MVKVTMLIHGHFLSCRQPGNYLFHLLSSPLQLRKRAYLLTRSAFKLLEIDKQCHLLQPGQVVVECGASPGAWTQVAVMGVNSLPHELLVWKGVPTSFLATSVNPRHRKAKNKGQGMVIRIDLQTIHPLPGATLLGGRDFTSPQTQQQILELLSSRKIDVVLSDMAPKASGIKDLDHENIIRLAYAALGFAIQNTAEGGSFLCKVVNMHCFLHTSLTSPLSFLIWLAHLYVVDSRRQRQHGVARVPDTAADQ
ncbi:rRNA methyltransferase 2, mitochondrial-like isoform X2 [Scylla paramamosain]|uniref:rRNA methyltransferase 2, mitochondrial-like isoform X2 n=1 Tax=Scylla paramamosain TaxID=85552 RepID=UPI003082E2EA